MENNIGGNIAKERHNQNMTQEQLAEFSDLTINYLSKIERGSAKQFSVITFSKISKALGVSMDSLVDYKQTTVADQPRPNQRQLNRYLDQLESDVSEQLSKYILKIIKVGQQDK